MNAVADTKDAISDPDNAASTRLFQAGRHDTVSSAIQDEHHPDNAASTRLFQGMNHDVAQNTFGAQYDLDKQPSSSFWKDVQGNGRRVSGLDAVETTDREVGNLDYDNHSDQSHPYTNSIHNGFVNSLTNFMKAEHMGTEFDKASEYPDLYTNRTPLQTARAGANDIGKINDRYNRQYGQTRFHHTDPTAESIHQAIEKYGNLLGGVAGTSLLMAVKRNLPMTGMTLSLNNWSRLSHEIYQRVYDKTGNDEFAQALGWGGAAVVAQDIASTGLFSKAIPVEYQTIYEPFSRVIDSIVSDHISNRIVDEGVERISKNKRQQDKPE